MTLFSFDIDGTLKRYGGPINAKNIRRTRKKGATIGGGSSRSVKNQRIIWQEMKIEPDFIVFKNNLPKIRKRYPEMNKFYHVDDTVRNIQGFKILRPEEFLTKFEQLLDRGEKK